MIQVCGGILCYSFLAGSIMETSNTQLFSPDTSFTRGAVGAPTLVTDHLTPDFNSGTSRISDITGFVPSLTITRPPPRVEFPILFEDATRVLPGEGRSKRLAPSSDLVKYLQLVRDRITTRFPVDNSRPWHIELLYRTRRSTGSDNITQAVLLRRAQAVQGRMVNVTAPVWRIMGTHAFVMEVGPVGDFGIGHITVAFTSVDLDIDRDCGWLRDQALLAALHVTEPASVAVEPETRVMVDASTMTDV